LFQDLIFITTCTILTPMFVCFLLQLLAHQPPPPAQARQLPQLFKLAAQGCRSSLDAFLLLVLDSRLTFFIFFLLSSAVLLLLQLSLQQFPKHLSFHQKLLAKVSRRYCTYLFKLQLVDFLCGTFFSLSAMCWRLEQYLCCLNI
jgi:hypothetical protein